MAGNSVILESIMELSKRLVLKHGKRSNDVLTFLCFSLWYYVILANDFVIKSDINFLKREDYYVWPE